MTEYCYDEPSEEGTKQTCFTEVELRARYEEDPSWGSELATFDEYLAEWIIINWAYKVTCDHEYTIGTVITEDNKELYIRKCKICGKKEINIEFYH